MIISIITAKVKGGGWVTLAQPCVPLVVQKAFFKQLKAVNGRGIRVENEQVDLEEAHLMVSGNGKRIRFKPAVEEPAPDGFLSSLGALANVLEISREKLDEMRKDDTFPVKEKAGYSVAAVKEWMENLDG